MHFYCFQHGQPLSATTTRRFDTLKRLERFIFSLGKIWTSVGLEHHSATRRVPRFHHAATSHTKVGSLCATCLHREGFLSIHHDVRMLQWSAPRWNALRPREEPGADARALLHE